MSFLTPACPARNVSNRAAEVYTFDAPIIVSNADALHTYETLVGEEHCGQWPIQYLKSLEPSYPCFLVHLGLRGYDPKALAGVLQTGLAVAESRLAAWAAVGRALLNLSETITRE
jgi:hypothetical protein